MFHRAALMLVAVGCSGELSGGLVPATPTAPGPDVPLPPVTLIPSDPVVPLAQPRSPEGTFECTAATARPHALRRLTRTEYRNTLEGLAGSAVLSALEPGLATLNVDEPTAGTAQLVELIDEDHFRVWERLADDAYRFVSVDAARSAAVAGPCVRQTPVTAACRRGVVEALGLRAFRRPLTPDERAWFETDVWALGSTPSESVAFVLHALLLSPHFLLHVETGRRDAVAGALPLTSYEVAARLSYAVWQAPPDAALLEAAGADALSSPPQVRAQAERLLLDPRARPRLKAFFHFWLEPRAYPTGNYPTAFLEGLRAVDAYGAASLHELDAFVEATVFDKRRSYRELLTDASTYSTDATLQQVYHPGRAGLLLRAPFLASKGADSNIIKRGVAVRTRLLCESIGAPSGISLTDPSLAGDDARRTSSNRERIHRATSVDGCRSCHTFINPGGFVFEGFDSLGRARTVESSFGQAGHLIARHPIDTRVSDVSVDGERLMVDDAMGLIDQLVRSNQGPACFSRQLLRFYENTREDLERDGCLLQAMLVAVKGQAGDYDRASVLAAVAVAVAESALERRITP